MGIAVSGIGIVSNLGIGKQAFWNTFNRFSSDGTSRVTQVYEQKRFGAVQFVPKAHSSLNFRKDLYRVDFLMLRAIEEALEESKILNKIPSDQIGIFCGTAHAQTQELEDFYKRLQKENTCRLRKILCGGYHNFNSTVAGTFQITGPRYTVATACSSSLLALKVATLKLQQDPHLKAALVYGVDVFSEMVFHGFLALGAMSETFACPFSGNYGMSLGEGAVAIVLTKEENSDYGYINDVALNCDAYHITASRPDGSGAYRLFTQLQQKNHLTNVDFVVAHGSGTASNDSSEIHALTTWASNCLQNPWVIGTKGCTGHTLGAAGLVNLAIACLALKQKTIPPIPKSELYKDKTLAVKIPLKCKSEPLHHIFVNAFGFGGNNAVTLLSKNNLKKDFFKTSSKKILKVGLVHRFGNDFDSFIESIINRRFSFHDKENFSFSKRFCAYRDFGISEDFYKRMRFDLKNYEFLKRLDRASTCLIHAVPQNLPTDLNLETIGTVFGSGTGPSEAFFKYYHTLVTSDFTHSNSILFPNTVSNTPVSYFCMKHQIKGPSFLLCDGALSASNAFETASLLLDNEDCEYVVCGSFDEYSENLEKAYLDIGLVKNRNHTQGCFLGELYTSFLLSPSFIEHKEPTLGFYNGCISSNIAPGPHHYPPGNQFIKEALQQAVRIFGMPDLILYNKKFKKEHDVLLEDAQQSILKNVISYSPTETFGYLLSGCTSLGTLIALACFQSKAFANSLLKTDKMIENVFILNLCDGGGCKVDNICKYEK